MKKILLVDNYDSFTYNLRDYLITSGTEVTVFRNDDNELENIEVEQWDGLIVSPGPKTPTEAGLSIPMIESFYQKKPVLGICLGHQAIGVMDGAQLVKAPKPVHGKSSFIKHNEHWIFHKLPNPFQAMRYHSLVLTNLDKTSLVCLAETEDDQTNMAIATKDDTLIGLQFHPESILTPFGKQILQNWIARLA